MPPVPKLFAPLDQYEPFVDELGRVTPEWYSWLTLLCDKLNDIAETEGDVLTAGEEDG